MHKFGFFRVACGVPQVELGNCDYNSKGIISLIDQAGEKKVEALLFPELAITGYSCGDLFFQKELQENALKGLKKIVDHSKGKKILIVVGFPLAWGGGLFNAAAVLNDGRILGIVIKSYLANDQEFAEKRWFQSAWDLVGDEVDLLGQKIPLGTRLLFEHESLKEAVLGVEIGQDLWAPIPPSSDHALAGATLILNPAATNDLIGKNDYQRALISNQSGRLNCAYLYASAGFGESTTDLVFGGHSIIAEKGLILAQGPRFSPDPVFLVADLDLEILMHDRQINHGYRDGQRLIKEKKYRRILFKSWVSKKTLRQIEPYPFVAEGDDRRCQEVVNIQTMALATRIKHIGQPAMVIGLSGGLDSTMALLVAINVCDQFNLPREKIHAIMMPGFGTTDRTYDNAKALSREFGLSYREIPIVDACLSHFKDIGHPAAQHDVTYENTQARERTQILMDLANQLKGIVVGTGDLSELALGWATYNGDHMSMYGVNAGVPKTLIYSLVKWWADQQANPIRHILYDILDTPVSPELLPPDPTGAISQKTEEAVGPYVLHDFFIYNMVRYGFSPEKIYYLACQAFTDLYEDVIILRWLKHFYSRFFSQQFKRSCLPDGPKVGSVSFSPRGAWCMPSDAKATEWLSALDKMS